MDLCKAVGFDLFNTLITMEPKALDEALDRLAASLHSSGLNFNQEKFLQAHWESAQEHLRITRQNGRETHNRFWISKALDQLGLSIEPDDPRIAAAVEAYFSSFLENSRLIPGTQEMLTTLKRDYRLGLLSNFTHGPAVRVILDQLGLSQCFDVLLISGELGFRKPHHSVFNSLTESLKVDKQELFYVGDDPIADIYGAYQSGLKPIWTTYVQDHNLPVAPTFGPSQKHYFDNKTPRISEWKDLLALLDQHPKN